MRFYVVVLAVVCLYLPVQSCQAGDQVVAIAQQSRSAARPVMLTPDLSVEEFNRRLDARDANETLLVTADFPREQVGLRGIVDRPAQYTWEKQTFSGRVTSVFVLDRAEAPTVRVLVRIDNRKAEGKWILPKSSIGTLNLSR